MTPYYILAFAVALATIPGFIARAKGRSFVWWWLFGVVLLIVAIPAAFLVSDRHVKPNAAH